MMLKRLAIEREVRHLGLLAFAHGTSAGLRLSGAGRAARRTAHHVTSRHGAHVLEQESRVRLKDLR
jgi:hypothetical protein